MPLDELLFWRRKKKLQVFLKDMTAELIFFSKYLNL